MTFSKLTLAVTGILTAGAALDAQAIELYMDSKTKQLYAAPCARCVPLGTFEKVDTRVDTKVKHKPQDTPAVAIEQKEEKNAADIAKIQNELELKNNEIKALGEHIADNREQKAKNDEKWFNKINLRGYTQLRYNQPLSGDRVKGDNPELASVGDSAIKNNSSFSFRRVRLVFSGDINDYVSLYIQPDFASAVDGSKQHFAQLRDAYADLAFDKSHEFRIRAGQSKVPFGWENLQSSQNRLALDRNDALNSAVPSERDLGLFAYYSPTSVQKLWKDLSKKGLKTSGDYGVLGFGVYNGQGVNREETNDDLYMVAHSTYPIELGFLGSTFNGQVLEIGADAISGRFDPALTPAGLDVSKGNILDKTATADSWETVGISNSTFKTFAGEKVTGNDLAANTKGQKFTEERVAVHAILFPQPFGLQAEWNWGKGPTLDVVNSTITKQSLSGGYVQALYKIDKIFGTEGTLIPYAKWQTYDGAWKGATNAPRVHTEEIEAGLEWQIMKALEIVVAYSYMDRTNVKDLGQAYGDMIRTQVQWNY